MYGKGCVSLWSPLQSNVIWIIWSRFWTLNIKWLLMFKVHMFLRKQSYVKLCSWQRNLTIMLNYGHETLTCYNYWWPCGMTFLQLKKTLKGGMNIKVMHKVLPSPIPYPSFIPISYPFFIICKIIKFGDGIWKLKTNDENRDDKILSL